MQLYKPYFPLTLDMPILMYASLWGVYSYVSACSHTFSQQLINNNNNDDLKKKGEKGAEK